MKWNVFVKSVNDEWWLVGWGEQSLVIARRQPALQDAFFCGYLADVMKF